MCRWVYYALLQKPQRRPPGHAQASDSLSTSCDYSLDSEAAAFLPQAMAPTANSDSRPTEAGVASANGNHCMRSSQWLQCFIRMRKRLSTVVLSLVSWTACFSTAADKASKPHLMSYQRRLSMTLRLYHYIGPLVIVYAAEYAMQVKQAPHNQHNGHRRLQGSQGSKTAEQSWLFLAGRDMGCNWFSDIRRRRATSLLFLCKLASAGRARTCCCSPSLPIISL